MQITIKMNPGNSLFIPETNKLLKPGESIKVTKNTFWNRRVKDGSVTIITEKSAFKTADKKETLNSSKEK